jgi:hypothetical protein
MASVFTYMDMGKICQIGQVTWAAAPCERDK